MLLAKFSGVNNSEGESRKGREIRENPHAALVFPWFPLQRQVLVQGPVERVDDAEADAYFGERPWGSRIGALASLPALIQTATEAGVRAVLRNWLPQLLTEWEQPAATPESEIGSLIIELRSATSGVGTFTYGFDHMSELTGRAAETVIQARKAEAA